MRRRVVFIMVVAGTAGLSAWSLVSNGHVRPSIVASLHAAQDEGCSLETLSGDYLLVGEAVPALAQRDDPSFPRRYAGIHTFDGQGNLSGFETGSQGGHIIRNITEGTYTLDANCSGTITFASGSLYDIFIAKDGSKGHYIRTDDGFIATRSIKKAVVDRRRRNEP
jgi:hypothetical protein